MWAVQEEAFLSLAKPQPRIRARRRIPNPSPWQETADFIEAQGPALPRLPFLLHGARTIQTTQALWKNTATRPRKPALSERFLFDRRLNVRQVQDCPIYGDDRTDGRCNRTVLYKLDELGLDQNTIIASPQIMVAFPPGDAYATSNLPSAGQGPPVGRRNPRTLYLKAPGITQPGSTCATPISGIDWYPTLLDLCGIESPRNSGGWR